MIINFFFRKIRLLKIHSMLENKISFRVRYGETDQMKYVYHGNYAQYFEMGRIEWLRNIGISYKAMENSGIMLPVHSSNTRFLKPAKYDDVLTLKTTLTEKPSVKIHFAYELFNQEKELIATGSTILVFVDMTKNKPVRMPDTISQKISPLFEPEIISQ